MPATTTRQSAAVELGAHREQPVQTGDADVVDPLDAGTEGARVRAASAATGPSLVPGREHGDAAARLGQAADRDGRTVDEDVVVRRGRRVHGRDRLRRRPGDERRHGRPRQPPDDVEHLAGGLAGAVHDLGVAGAQRPVRVDGAGELLVRRSARSSRSARSAVGRTGGDGVEQRRARSRSTRRAYGPAPPHGLLRSC